jgi:cytochrome P450
MSFHYITEIFGSKTIVIYLPFLPPFVLINSRENIEHVLNNRFDNYIKGPLLETRLLPMFGHGIFNTDGDNWHMQRKVGARIFTTRVFKKLFETVFLDNIHTLNFILENSIKNEKIVDIFDLMLRYFLDSFAKIAFSAKLDCLSDSPLPFAVAFDKSQTKLMKRFLTPFYKLTEYFDPHIKKDFEFVRNFGRELIRERRANPKQEQEQDLLQLFMDYSQDGVQLTEEQLIDQVINFIIAGRDTTAQAVSWAIYELSDKPDIVKKMREEIKETCGESDFTYENVKNMTFIHSVFMETLRLHPSVPCEMKYTVEDDVLPDGCLITKGASIVWSTYAFGRSKLVWNDPLLFFPERWLDKQYSQYEAPFFNGGPRICLGKTLAELQGVFVLAYLVNRFDFNVLNRSSVRYMPSLTLPIRDGLKCKINLAK